jgi:hypothetical protein
LIPAELYYIIFSKLQREDIYNVLLPLNTA